MASLVDNLKGPVDKQHRDLQRALLGLPSPYVLRPKYQNSIDNNDDFFDSQPGHWDDATRSLKVLIDLENYKQVFNYQPDS